jgi:hypothetical protein
MNIPIDVAHTGGSHEREATELKKLASVGVSLLVVVVTLSMLAGPADARRRHHRHHRGGGGGGGVTCGPGTVLSGGVCVAVPTGPVGNGNVAITPSSVTLTNLGAFSTNIIVSGLPPLTTALTLASPGLTAACPGGSGLAAIGGVDATGRLVIIAVGFNCVAATFPITFTETASPFQTFTGFLTLHF